MFFGDAQSISYLKINKIKPCLKKYNIFKAKIQYSFLYKLLMNDILETQRLLIEPLSKNDYQFIFKLVNSEGWIKFIGNRNVNDEKEATGYIQKILDNKNYVCHVFRLKENKEPIGIITLIKRDNYNSPDIGFALLPHYEKKGFTYEAAKKYLDVLIKEAAYEEIIGITLNSNFKSIKLLEKLGLRFKEKRIDNNEELSIYSILISALSA
jgi:RimJ/RimL family protein N-acetyltransferase